MLQVESLFIRPTVHPYFYSIPLSYAPVMLFFHYSLANEWLYRMLLMMEEEVYMTTASTKYKDYIRDYIYIQDMGSSFSLFQLQFVPNSTYFSKVFDNPNQIHLLRRSGSLIASATVEIQESDLFQKDS